MTNRKKYDGHYHNGNTDTDKQTIIGTISTVIITNDKLRAQNKKRYDEK